MLDSEKYILIVVILFFAIGVGILNYFYNKEDAISVPSVSKEVAEDKDDQEEETVIVPEEKWKTYTNSELGFSIEYPETVHRTNKCSQKEPFYVPLKVFEDNENGVVYITEEYYYNAKFDNELNEYIEPCKKIINSLELWHPGWAISTRNIENEDELNKFIKNNYSSGCFMESKNFWQQQAGVYEIKLNVFKDANGNNTDLGNAVCPVNYAYKILYIPEKNKVMSVKLGQECGFGTRYVSEESYKCYDNEMINSFKFE